MLSCTRMKTRDTARLSDVARAAEVSLSTASRALADPALVRPETRERVRQAAELLRYVPHGAARALRGRGSRAGRRRWASLQSLSFPIPDSDNEERQA